MQILFLIHTGSCIILIIFIFIISRQIQNVYLKDFLSTFSFCTFLLFICGLLNFIPGTGALCSSFGIIIFSVIIVFSFMRMHTIQTVNFNRIMERQKKLDNAGNLTASLVHEVKNTLQIINGFSSLLSELPSLPSEGKKMNEMIQSAGQQLDGLLRNYTEFLKYKSIDFKMVDLNEIIEQAIEISEEFIKRNSVVITFDKKYRTLKTHANQTYLKQVFVNLIKNSSEAFPKESSERKIIISTDIQIDKIMIDFMDTGKGISTNNWESIFDPFTSSKKDGLGLGLPFVKNIIFEHRGDIKVMDSGPKGTHIQIILPQYSFSDF
ncbi:sensor histidine kinase [Bacillus sp. USDA818B3_A]|uniref:sensor histidine kinase n=1 Tax=Bacillus sp. USDA818B3_A TaxID=2698834 RepID=UPI001368B01F|nr:HAMP domain-containing sensor histidine kinase [Bacillus sp. USDA818B3_A]